MIQYSINIPNSIKPYPNDAEVSAAEIISRYFKKEVTFLIPGRSYKQKTPDVVVGGIMWEIKAPKGNSQKNTIEYQIKIALKQSKNIIIDTRYTKLNDTLIVKQTRFLIKKHRTINKLLIILKSGLVISIKH